MPNQDYGRGGTLDKYEYKIRAEEIKTLISQKKYVDAAKVADTIDWTRVKSVMMLCTVSDLYKVNRRFEDAKLLLEMANERHPAGRMIIYSLCDLSIKMGEVVQAVEYYKDFTQIAPNDSGRYVLQYKLYEAQDVGLEERIAVLEELKKRDYREKWAYELAYLYHRVGLATKCVEECDELILWFGEGKYVMKAMELKMLHQPLSPAQQQKYEAYMMRKQGLRVPEPEDKQDKNSEGRKKAEEDDIHVKPMDVGKYNTINLQKELAKSMEELMLNGRQPAGDPVSLQEYRDQMAGQENSYADQSYDIEAEDTGEMIPQEYDPAQYGEETYTYEDLPAAAGPEYPEAQMQPEAAAALQPDYYAVQEEPAAAVQEPVQESSENLNPDLSNYLSQEYDGQIGLVVPDGYQVERQITGQMNIEDIMKEWEKMKLENLTPEIDVKGIKITQPDINRPALQMAGYFEHYEATRLQIIGFVEYTYMESMTEERKQKIYNQLLSYPIFQRASSGSPFPSDRERKECAYSYDQKSDLRFYG